MIRPFFAEKRRTKSSFFFSQKLQNHAPVKKKTPKLFLKCHQMGLDGGKDSSGSSSSGSCTKFSPSNEDTPLLLAVALTYPTPTSAPDSALLLCTAQLP